MSSIADELNIEDEFYFQWHITEKCNFRCKHCYHGDYTSANELSLSELIFVADKIDSTLRKWDKIGTLSITGGEPFMVIDKLFPLLQHINSLETINHFDLLTNGSLLDEDILSKLKGFRKLRRVQVSLEAGNQKLNDQIRGNGSFEKTLSAIRLLKQNGFQVAVMMTISHMNKNEVELLIELLKKEGVDTFSAERFIPEGAGANLKDELLTAEEVREVFQKIYSVAMKEDNIRILLYRPLFALLNGNDPTVGALCSIGNNALTIMHDGTIYPCRRLPIPIGNALTDSFYKVWYTSEVLWNVRNQKNIKGKCADCDLTPVCRGCRAMAYALTGDYLAEDSSMLEIKQNDIFVLEENIFLQKISELGKYWVFNVDTGEHYTLNESSYWILEQIAETLPAKNILKSFLGNFDVGEKQGKDDFVGIVNGFLTAGIIKKEGER